MKKFKKNISTLLTVMILTTSLSVPVLASDTHKTEGNSISNDIFEATEFTVETNGYVEHIIINENREIFVNGRNITTITSTTNNNIGIMSLSEDWIKAGTEEYHYNLGGLSVSAAVGILKKLGKTAAISTLEKVLGAAGALAGAYVLDGVYIRDVRTTWYRNIDRPGRPEMKQTHDVSLVVFGITVLTF